MRAYRSAATLGAALALAGICAGEVFAAGVVAPKTRAPELQAIVDCRALADRDARLNCYDAAAAKLDQAEAAGQVVVVNREQVRKVRKDVFGLQLPSLDIFNAVVGKGKAGAAEAEDSNRLQSVVKTAWRGGDGRWSLELETGAVWRQTDDFQLANDPHPGSKADIRQGALGSFFMKIDGQPAFKAHRDR